jgi:hypothetical protein
MSNLDSSTGKLLKVFLQNRKTHLKTLIVVNGEQYWQEYFPGYQVHYRRLQNSKWLYHEDKLWVLDQSGTIAVDGVLWRVGAIRPHPNHRSNCSDWHRFPV